MRLNLLLLVSFLVVAFVAGCKPVPDTVDAERITVFFLKDGTGCYVETDEGGENAKRFIDRETCAIIRVGE
jgi:hypothetical protein